MKSMKKQALSKREEIRNLIATAPGITSAEIAERLNFATSSMVTTALWTSVKTQRIIAERIERNGKMMNAYFLPEHASPDMVERINQKVVDASHTTLQVTDEMQNSVFDIAKSKVKRRERSALPSHAGLNQRPASGSALAFAIVSDGSLLLMRAGRVEFTLSEEEAALLQTYLVRSAAAQLLVRSQHLR